MTPQKPEVIPPLPDIDAREELHKIGVGIHCPSCDWKQIVPLDEWLFQSKYGHGYTCGSGKCPSHTYLVRDIFEDQPPDLWNELRMIEALEHVASTGSWDAMNAYIAECRKQAEERMKVAGK